MSKLVLVTDFTKIHPGLVKGAECEFKFCSRGCDCLWNVYFPTIGNTYAFYSKNFDLPEEEKKAEHEKFLRDLKIATEIEYTHGPRGGNKKLEYQYIDPVTNKTRYGWTMKRDKVLKGLDFLNENNIPYTDTVFKKS